MPGPRTAARRGTAHSHPTCPCPAIGAQAIRPFLDARTVAKIRSVHGREAVEDALSGLLTDEQRAWVDEAMALDPVPGNLPTGAPMPAAAPAGPEVPLSAEILGIGPASHD